MNLIKFLQAENGEKKPKKVTKTIDLPIITEVHNLPKEKLNAIIELEAQMVQNDKLENERINAKVCSTLFSISLVN